MWTILKVITEFVTTLFLFYDLVFWLQGVWNLGSLTRDQTLSPCSGRGGLNLCDTREVLRPVHFKQNISNTLFSELFSL